MFCDVSTKRDTLTRLCVCVCVDRDRLRKEPANKRTNKQNAITELHKVTNKLCYSNMHVNPLKPGSFLCDFGFWWL